MEATPLDTRSSLNAMEGLNLPAKTPPESSTQEGQPDGSSLFAGILVQKISEANLSGSVPDPKAAPQGGKLPHPDPPEGMIVSGKGETADGERAKSEVRFTKEAMEHAIAMPPAVQSASPAGPSPAESAVGPIAHPDSPDPALFAQAVGPQGAMHLEGKADATPTGKASHKDSTIPAAHEPLPPSGLHADHRSAPEGDEQGAKPAFIPRTAETPQPKNGGLAADASPEPHPSSPSPQGHGKRAGESKYGASVASAPQQPVPEARPEGSVSERMTPAGSPGKALPAGDVAAETPEPASGHQSSQKTAAGRTARHPEPDIFPFRMEMPAASPQATGTPVAAGPAGIEMQAVIDQILEARQAVGNDFGRIRILLNPPNLGAVDLDIVVRGERVEVVMTAESATVQQALQSRGEDIRIALQRQDLKIEGFQVLLQDNGASQQQAQGGGAMYRQDREDRERFNAVEDAAPALPFPSPIAGMKSAPGRVSIFA